MKKSKLLVLSILTALLVLLFSACSAQDNNGGTAGSGDSDIDAPGESELTEPQEDSVFANLPEGNFNGHVFRVLNNQSNFALTLFDSEEITGNILEDAIFNRNRRVEAALNIEIVEISESWANITTLIRNSVNAGDDNYDIFFNEAYLVSPLALQGMLVDINDVPGINLDKPWWDNGSIAAYTVRNRLYFVNGELHLMGHESVLPVMFNKNLAQDYSLDNIYDLVNNGQWTLDRFYDMMRAVVADLDGDGVITGFDQFGATTHDGMFTGFFVSMGENIMRTDNDGMPYLVPFTERSVEVYNRLIEVMTDGTVVARGSVTPNITPDDGGNSWHDIFISGRSLFYLEYLGSARKLRAMEQNFGIVPFPKFNEAQPDYIAYVGALAAVLAIPVTNSDLERTSIILENINAESYRSVRPAYYDIMLHGQTIRDEESGEMLDLIFDRRTYEFGAIFSFPIVGTLNTNLAQGRPEIASTMERQRERTEIQIENNFGDW